MVQRSLNVDYGCGKLGKIACDWWRKAKDWDKKEECYIKTVEERLQYVQILKSGANVK